MAKENGDFAVEWSSGTPPDHSDASDTCVVELPILLRQESPLGTYSYGHMLRDNYYHLIQIPKAFDLNIASFAWVTWPRERGNNAFTAMPVLAKINSLLSPHRTRRWFELESDCGEKGNTVGPGACTVRPDATQQHVGGAVRCAAHQIDVLGGTGALYVCRCGLRGAALHSHRARSGHGRERSPLDRRAWRVQGRRVCADAQPRVGAARHPAARNAPQG